jgi:hypothetical protein
VWQFAQVSYSGSSATWRKRERSGLLVIFGLLLRICRVSKAGEGSWSAREKKKETIQAESFSLVTARTESTFKYKILSKQLKVIFILFYQV